MQECLLRGGMCEKGFPPWGVGGEEGQMQVRVQMWSDTFHAGSGDSQAHCWGGGQGDLSSVWWSTWQCCC